MYGNNTDLSFVFQYEYELHVCTRLAVEMLHFTCNVGISELLRCFQMKG